MTNIPTHMDFTKLQTLIWVMFFTSTFIYNLVIMLTVEAPMILPLNDLFLIAQHNPTILGSVVIAIGASVWSMILARTPLNATPEDQPRFLIRLAIAQAPAIIGMVIALTASLPQFLWAGSVLSTILFLLNRPPVQPTL